MQRARLIQLIADRQALTTTRSASFLCYFCGIRDAKFFGFSCSCSCSVEDGARARIPSFEYDYEHHFIEHEQDFLVPSSNNATSKLAPAVHLVIALVGFGLRLAPAVHLVRLLAIDQSSANATIMSLCDCCGKVSQIAASVLQDRRLPLAASTG